MSYTTIADCAADATFGRRVAAAYAKEGTDAADAAWQTMHWAIAADPSIEPPYESAIISGNPDPGGDPSVITDGMLTAAVQAHPYTP